MILKKHPIERNFFTSDTVIVAKDILGKMLVRRTSHGILVGRIVEAEAYRGTDDPASHSYRGKTKRNEVMFGKPGITYVYFTYGNHYCLNVVTEKVGIAAAVLIRAVEPLIGIETMKRNRNIEELTNVASGPGKLTQALQISCEDNGLDVTSSTSSICIYESNEPEEFQIVQTTRVGIRVAQELPWRFYIQGNPHVSKR